MANSGKVAYTWDNAAQLNSGKLSVTLDPSYSYYFIRVTQRDGDLAVTSPVWVGESLKLGISNMVCGTATPVTDEGLTLTTTFFNSEDSRCHHQVPDLLHPAAPSSAPTRPAIPSPRAAPGCAL